MNKNIKKITVIFENFWMFTRSLMWKRDDSIVLIGAWFGNKFADNSRYLFQMLPIMVLLMMSGMYKSQWIYNKKFEI